MIDYTEFGFRKDYDPYNKFHLKTEVEYKGKSYIVSTVDLGINHSFIEGVELYYETMIFKNSENIKERWGDGNPFEYFQERYSTENEARKRHEEIVEIFKSNKVDKLL